jgi:hypothetical protein
MVKINLQSLQEDLRKIGIAVMLAGFADIFFAEQTMVYSKYIALIGFYLWLAGIYKIKE